MDKITKASSKLVPLRFTSALQMHEQRTELIRITTGAKGAGQVLEGGIESECITEDLLSFGRGRDGDLSHVVCNLPINSRLGGRRGKSSVH